MPEQAIVADVGRTALRLGITDTSCRLRPETVRTFSPEAEPTVSGAISGIARDYGLIGGRTPLAIAVSGVPRGETISVTNGRWRISRSGLASMLQRDPLVLNDFAANAWAIGDRGSAALDPITGDGVKPQLPGSYCIIGVGSGLGVALLSRDHAGRVTVVPTEAGHTAFPSGFAGLLEIEALIGKSRGFISAETVLSGPGLLALYAAKLARSGVNASPCDPSELIRRGLASFDEHAVSTLRLFSSALWYFAGNLTLAYGAFDGVILTGSLASAMKKFLTFDEAVRSFLIPSPYQKHLAAVPRSLSTLAHPELAGAAVALRTMLS